MNSSHRRGNLDKRFIESPSFVVNSVWRIEPYYWARHTSGDAKGPTNFSLSLLNKEALLFLPSGFLIRQRQTEVCRTFGAHFID